MSYQSAKRKADKWFSKYIRLRDADDNGYAHCITCGKTHKWQEMDCGHFVLRDKLQTRYNEKNSHAQCKYCNRFRAGKQYNHGKAIDQRYGEGTAEFLEGIGNKNTKYAAHEIETIAQDFKQRFQELQKEKPL